MKKFLIILVCFCLLILVCYGILGIRDHRETMRYYGERYEKAVALMNDGQWSEAADEFRFLRGRYYLNSGDLFSFCIACRELEDGEPYRAETALADVTEAFSQHESVVKLRENIESTKEGYEDLKRFKEERRRKEQEQMIRNGEPYVGMSESWIDSTRWGAHGKLRHNTYSENGKIYEANLYDFFQNGRLRYTVRCARGSVKDIQDWGDAFGALTKPPGHAGNGNNIPASVQANDPYDVNNYTHPDDFYYDRRDDFVDFEEAEDYYYEHSN